MANIETIKWDGVSDKETIAATLWEYLDEDEKALAKRTSYGDLGNYLKKRYGARFRSGTAGDYFVWGEPNEVKVEIDTTRYILTWNKAAKLIHGYIKTAGADDGTDNI